MVTMAKVENQTQRRMFRARPIGGELRNKFLRVWYPRMVPYTARTTAQVAMVTTS